jgi:hypothetical protein
MVLAEPRLGESGGFSVFPHLADERTIGDPEKIVWSSINHLCAREVADAILFNIYKIRKRSTRLSIAFNLKVYLSQANQFYCAAKSAEARTSPLFYYYCFLNLAKAVCEIKEPNLHKRAESFRHGISWTPSKDYLVDMEKEVVRLTTKGMWHELYEAVVENPVTIPNPIELKIKDLFAYSPETSIEYEKTYYNVAKLINLEEIDTFVDVSRSIYWIRFSIYRGSLRQLGLGRARFLALITYNGSRYIEVESSEKDAWTFELEKPKKIPKRQKEGLYRLLEKEIRAMNLFVHMGEEGIEYWVPVQTRLPFRIPQIIQLYSLIFWLGSLVRYDPHSVAWLQESKYWILIDGFLNQSIVWLLELFEWKLYQRQTFLKSVR